MSKFGDLVRGRRAELRLSLRDFAMRADVDAGNLSKLERGRLNPPQDAAVLDRICVALEWDPQGNPAQELRDIAAVENGRIPEDLLNDEEVLSRMPLLLRTVHNRQLDHEEIEKLIDVIRRG
jgi:transcriptional regulator with XRE-family HTH domain